MKKYETQFRIDSLSAVKMYIERQAEVLKSSGYIPTAELMVEKLEEEIADLKSSLAPDDFSHADVNNDQ